MHNKPKLCIKIIIFPPQSRHEQLPYRVLRTQSGKGKRNRHADYGTRCIDRASRPLIYLFARHRVLCLKFARLFGSALPALERGSV